MHALRNGLIVVRSDYLVLLAFILVVLFGGSNAVAVRFSNLGLPPFWGAAVRFGTAALICLRVRHARGARSAELGLKPHYLLFSA